MHRTIGIEAAYKMLGEPAPSQLFVTQVRLKAFAIARLHISLPS